MLAPAQYNERGRPTFGRVDDRLGRPADQRVHVPFVRIGKRLEFRFDRAERRSSILLVYHRRRGDIGHADSVRERRAHGENANAGTRSPRDRRRDVQRAGRRLVAGCTHEEV
jgi:hypothetical protein